ncbi:MAG: ATP-dependent DNA ligase [Candidatus Woesearchaeota archaeon]
MEFKELVGVFEELEKTSSGNKLREILANFFKRVPKNEIKIVSYFILGLVAPEYESVDFGIAERMMIRAVSRAYNRKEDEIKKLLKSKGDLGIVAFEIGKSLKINKKRDLKISEVHKRLLEIAKTTGSGSQDKKISLLSDLLLECNPEEAKYIIRILLGRLRLGVASMTILDSLSIAFTGTKENKKFLEEAYNLCTDIGLVAELIATKGIDGIKRIEIQVGSPIQMMLAQRVKKLSEIKEKMPNGFYSDAKYDGERVQIHKKENGDVVIYSRRLENITTQYPDIVENIKKAIKEKKFIVEGEAVPIDDKGNILPFQTLMQRKRKYDVEKYVKKIPIRVFLFDILYLNGKSLIKTPYPERRKILEKITNKNNFIMLSKILEDDDLDKVDDFFQEVLDEGCEGIIAKSKSRDSFYRAGARAWLWIKYKKDYVSKLQDTLDLVVVGAFAGKGKRAGSYGALLCASYNPKTDMFETVSKLGAGFSDEILSKLPKIMKPYLIPKKHARVDSEIEADYWFIPNKVVVVVGAEITQSPVHTCAKKQLGKGLAIRFPRFKMFRDDKSPEQATTTQEIIQMYKK